MKASDVFKQVDDEAIRHSDGARGRVFNKVGGIRCVHAARPDGWFIYTDPGDAELAGEWERLPRRVSAAESEARIADLEAENARLKRELEDCKSGKAFVGEAYSRGDFFCVNQGAPVWLSDGLSLRLEGQPDCPKYDVDYPQHRYTGPVTAPLPEEPEDATPPPEWLAKDSPALLVRGEDGSYGWAFCACPSLYVGGDRIFGVCRQDGTVGKVRASALKEVEHARNNWPELAALLSAGKEGE